jgi:hypothetical protein
MGFFDFLFGSKDKVKQLPTMNYQQQKGLSQFFKKPITKSPGFQQGQDYLSQLLSGAFQPNYETFDQPYLQNFEEQIVPGLAERFAGMGTGAGGLNSSAFTNSIAQAGRGLQSDLASMRENLKFQNQGQMLQGAGQQLQYAQQPYSNLLAAIGQRPFENTYQPGSTGLLGGAFQGIAGGFGQGFGNQFGKDLFNY